jgi:hypothetical protein
MVATTRQVEQMIRARRPLCDIQQPIDSMHVDEEAKAALWLRAYEASRPSFQRQCAAGDIWRRNRVGGA